MFWLAVICSFTQHLAFSDNLLNYLILFIYLFISFKLDQIYAGKMSIY